FVGSVPVGYNSDYSLIYNMVAFGAGGDVRWIVPNDQPQIALAGGGVIGQSGIRYDESGNATGQIGDLSIQSWIGNAYTDGPVDQVAATPNDYASSFAALAGGN